MSYILNRASSRWTTALLVCAFASAAAAHEVLTVSGEAATRLEAHVGYYFDANNKALFAERMKSVAGRAVKPPHDGTRPPAIPQTPNANDTKTFVKNACPAGEGDRTNMLSKWDTKFGKAKFVAYFSVDYLDPKNPLRLLAIEELSALTPEERDQRSVRLLCKQEEGEDMHCGGGHRCTIPCGSGCCCP